jgi:hypothetical protein
MIHNQRAYDIVGEAAGPQALISDPEEAHRWAALERLLIAILSGMDNEQLDRVEATLKEQQ